jgi:hypothetical protein
MDDADAVTLKITPHQAQRLPAPPAEAVGMLWRRLGSNHEGASFSRRGSEIRAMWESTASRSIARGELNEIARAAILDLLRDVCDRAPELEFDWFAVSPM